MVSGKSNNSLEVAFVQRDEYVYSIVQNLVDNVCLHDARTKTIRREHKNSNAAVGEEEGKGMDEEEALELKISGLSLNPVH